MTLTLTSGDWDDLRWQEVVTCPKNLVLENFESLTGVPESIGCGYCRDVELSPGVELSFSESQYHQDVRLAAPAHDHPIQISVFLSGYIDCDIHPTLGGDLSYFSGSGVSPAYGEIQSGGQPLTCLNLEISGHEVVFG